MINWEEFCKLGKPQYPFVKTREELNESDLSRIIKLEQAVFRWKKLAERSHSKVVSLEAKLNKLEERINGC